VRASPAVVGQFEQEALDATTSEGDTARLAPASVSSQLAHFSG